MTSAAPDWQVCSFSELAPLSLYRIIQLREEVFVVEQNCVYRDLDGKDQASFHLYCERGDAVLAYLRCLPPGLSYPESSLGRIVVSPQARGQQLGRELVERGIAFNHATWPHIDIVISAQAYLQDFYCSLGFKVVSDLYDEDGIPHYKMFLEAS